MKIYKYILLLFAGILFHLSCTEDFVDLQDPNRISTGSFWATEADALAGTDAIYQALQFDGLYRRIYNWVMDVRADDLRNSSPWWIEWVAAYTVQTGNPCYNLPWFHNYIGIWRANQLLENIESIEMDAELRNRLIGEAKFLRGLYYYHLAILYKNVPLILATPKSPEVFYPSQAAPEETWNQIIKDFSEAINALWNKNDSRLTPNDLGRATKGAAAAYLAKSLMINGRFSEAESVLKRIIDGEFGIYALMLDYRFNFDEAHENNSESLFEVQFNRNVGGMNVEASWGDDPAADWTKTSGKARTYSPVPYGYGDIAPTEWIFDEFKLEQTTDGQDDPRLVSTMWYDNVNDTVELKYGQKVSYTTLKYARNIDVADQRFIKKYLNYETLPNELEWRSGINERIMRYDDVLLLYAECLNEANRTSDAYFYIQLVRSRVNLPDLSVTKPGMSQEQMRDQIAHERALEFCFEAQRYVDLLRWGWFDNPTKVQELIQHDGEYGLWTEGREYLAIPLGEIALNENLKQNEGWSP
jgi:starch-binding outer membrane protein, SusD/RagB family